ncbi:MAG TPA: aminotransferase class I/II-fold pyridoxal phosphate-dependent enzyme, partial [Spirochaetota bacterium]|nr:aminotransferase class I/II-fold pyridoxal phosphate-dependent enzyme [Spirochaetota bacterium]
MNDKRYDFFYKEIEELKSKDLYRTLVSVNMNCGRNIALDGKEYVNFASNNYLDLANDKRIIEAGCKTAYEYGAGSGASRLISGSIEPVFKLENEFARFSGKESSLLFNSGYNANVGVISALSDKNTVIFSDKLNHASIYDGIFLSGAAMERFPHKNIEILKKLLLKHSDKKKKIIITDTVFSMEGSIA